MLGGYIPPYSAHVVEKLEKSGASKRGLSREAQAASLRVRIWPECPERYLRELIWASKPDCGITTM